MKPVFYFWTIKKAECQRIDAFKLWCWRRLLRIPWTARRSNSQSCRKSTVIFIGKTDAVAPILGHMMRRANSLEKTLMLGKSEGKRRRRQQRMRWLDSNNSMDMSLSKLHEIEEGRGDWHIIVHSIAKSWT